MARIPILMYHNLLDIKSKEKCKGLTLSLQDFEDQLAYLYKKGYKTFFLSELEKMDSLPKKTVLITFDDITVNQIQAVELLKKYNFKATFFIPFAYIGKMDSWNKEASQCIMNLEQLRNLDPKIIELGHHSFTHCKYSSLNREDIKMDFSSSFEYIIKNKLNVYPALAFPYGNYPKKNPNKQMFIELLEEFGFKYAFRIGNRLNSFPFKNPFFLKRIDIKGEDSLLIFKMKLKIGKLRLF